MLLITENKNRPVRSFWNKSPFLIQIMWKQGACAMTEKVKFPIDLEMNNLSSLQRCRLSILWKSRKCAIFMILMGDWTYTLFSQLTLVLLTDLYIATKLRGQRKGKTKTIHVILTNKPIIKQYQSFALFLYH